MRAALLIVVTTVSCGARVGSSESSPPATLPAGSVKHDIAVE
jgi:hypothetical protein